MAAKAPRPPAGDEGSALAVWSEGHARSIGPLSMAGKAAGRCAQLSAILTPAELGAFFRQMVKTAGSDEDLGLLLVSLLHVGPGATARAPKDAAGG